MAVKPNRVERVLVDDSRAKRKRVRRIEKGYDLFVSHLGLHLEVLRVGGVYTVPRRIDIELGFVRYRHVIALANLISLRVILYLVHEVLARVVLDCNLVGY